MYREIHGRGTIQQAQLCDNDNLNGSNNRQSLVYQKSNTGILNNV